MSSSVRTALAAAAQTVAGVNCTPYFRQSLKPGDGFVRLARRGPDPAIGSTDTWQIWIALAQDVMAAEKWLDQYLDQLEVAMSTEMTVTSIQPTEFTTGATSVNGVVVEGDREA